MIQNAKMGAQTHTQAGRWAREDGGWSGKIPPTKSQGLCCVQEVVSGEVEVSARVVGLSYSNVIRHIEKIIKNNYRVRAGMTRAGETALTGFAQAWVLAPNTYRRNSPERLKFPLAN